MKKTIMAVVIACAPLSAYGAGGYFEGVAGYGFVDDVGVQGSDTSPEAGTISGVRLEYDNAPGFGLELGVREFEKHNVLRFGVAWDRFDAELDRALFSATGGTDLAAGEYSISSDDLRDLGLDFDNQVNVYTANLYYDFPSNSDFRFFFGAGIGVADVEHARDNELAWRFALGGRYRLNKTTYLGLRWDYFGIDEIDDELGLRYDRIAVNRVGINVMVEF